MPPRAERIWMNKDNVIPFAQDAGFFERRGDLKLESGDTLEAMGFYRRAIQLDPSSPTLHTKLGAVYNALGANRQALSSFCHALRLGGADDPALYFHMGSLYMDFHHYDAAMACFRELSKLHSEDDSIEVEFELDHGFSEALSAYYDNDPEKELAEETRLKMTQLSLEAMQKLGKGDNKSAIALFERVWALDPTSADQASNLAMALYCDGQYARSLTVCNSALISDRNTSRLHCIKALIYNATDEPALLKKEVEYLTGIAPADAFDAIKIGVTLFDVREPGAALTVFEKGLADHPYHTDLLHCAAVCLNNLGRVDEAIEKFDLGLQIDPVDPVLRHFHTLLKAKRDLGEAPTPITVCFRDLPVEMVIHYTTSLGKMQTMTRKEILEYPDWLDMVEWSLRRADSWHIAALNVLATVDPGRAELELRSRLCDASVPPEIQKTYLGLLTVIQAEGPFLAFTPNGISEVSISVMDGLEMLPDEYKQVIMMFAEIMSERNEPETIVKMGVDIWHAFIAKVIDCPPEIKPEDVAAYCAALEYSAKQVTDVAITQKEVMERYSINRYRFNKANNMLYDKVFVHDDDAETEE